MRGEGILRAFSGISIHAPHEGERHHSQKHDKSENPISIHAPHEGERRGNAALKERKNDFNPRSPRGGATRSFLHHQTAFMNFNPRSPRGGATVSPFAKCSYNVISIHAPHEGERLSICPQACTPTAKFQSTLPTRGSDHRHEKTAPLGIHFNPRSPRGGATFKP